MAGYFQVANSAGNRSVGNTAYLKMFLEVGSACIPKEPHYSTKNGTMKDSANQWLSTYPKSIISFKFNVKILFFNVFITLHLGKGHIQTINWHSGYDGIYYSQFI